MVQGTHRVSTLGRTCARRSLVLCRLCWATPVALGAFDVRVRRTFPVRGAALQTLSQTYATNLASSLCAPASRPYPEILPHLYRTRLSLLPLSRQS